MVPRPRGAGLIPIGIRVVVRRPVPPSPIPGMEQAVDVGTTGVAIQRLTVAGRNGLWLWVDPDAGDPLPLIKEEYLERLGAYPSVPPLDPWADYLREGDSAARVVVRRTTDHWLTGMVGTVVASLVTGDDGTFSVLWDAERGNLEAHDGRDAAWGSRSPTLIHNRELDLLPEP